MEIGMESELSSIIEETGLVVDDINDGTGYSVGSVTVTFHFFLPARGRRKDKDDAVFGTAPL